MLTPDETSVVLDALAILTPEQALTMSNGYDTNPDDPKANVRGWQALAASARVKLEASLN